MTSELVQTLECIVGAEHLLADAEARRYAVDGVAPAVVVFPENIEQVSAALAACGAAKAAVVPWGGGAHMGLGTTPTKVDVVLALGRMNRLLDHEPGDMTATVQAGMALSAFQTHLSRHGQWLALDASGAGRATLGGVLAANISGPCRHRYGTARDLLIGLRVVDASGTVFKGGARVVKNVTGYDMNKLYVGSLGSLGVIAEATFRLHPVPRCERTLVAAFPTAGAAGAAVARVLDSPLVPSAVELLNEAAASEVGRTSGTIMGSPGVVVAVSIASVPEAVAAQVQTAQGMLGEANGSFVLEGPAHDAFWAAVRDFGSGERSAVILKASVPINKVAEAMERGEQLAAQHGLRNAVVSEAGAGVLRFYCRVDDGEDRASGLARMADSLRDFAVQSRGSLVVAQAPVAVKSRVDVWGPPGSGLALMRGLKEQFDPGNILNPGRFVGGI